MFPSLKKFLAASKQLFAAVTDWLVSAEEYLKDNYKQLGVATLLGANWKAFVAVLVAGLHAIGL